MYGSHSFLQKITRFFLSFKNRVKCAKEQMETVWKKCLETVWKKCSKSSVVRQEDILMYTLRLQ